MIDISKLVQDRPLKGNFFAPDAYVRGEFEFGLIENRSGSRLLALPDTLLKALFSSLDHELGQGAGIALFSCGRWWGEAFFQRFADEVGEYKGMPITQMEMIQFLQCLKECWKTHGWGLLDIDLKYYQQGFVVAKIEHSAFVEAAPQGKRPMGFLEAGILSAFFSKLTGQNLHCIQTRCQSLGNDDNQFVLGLRDRIAPAQAWLEEGHDHATIMELLCRTQMN